MQLVVDVEQDKHVDEQFVQVRFEVIAADPEGQTVMQVLLVLNKKYPELQLLHCVAVLLQVEHNDEQLEHE